MAYNKYDKRRMLTGAPWKEVLIFSIPLVLSAILQNMYGVVDTYLVGDIIGEDALAAVGSVSILIALYQCVSWGFSFGINAVLARYNGAGNDEQQSQCAHTAVTFMILLGLAVFVLGLLTGKLIMSYVMGIPEELMEMSEQYLYIGLIGVIFTFAYNSQGSILRSVGNTRYLLYALIVTSIANIIMDVVFIVVLNLGVAGAALSTALCHMGSFIILAALIRRYYPELSMSRKDFRIKKNYMKEIVDAGLPMAGQQIIIFGSYIICQNPINSYGTDMMAAFAVERRVETILRIPMTAFGAGMITFTGMTYGARDKNRLFLGVKQIWLMSMLVTIAIAAVSFLMSPFLMSAFNLTGVAYDYGVEFMRVVSISLPLFTGYFALHGFFQGIKKPLVCTGITFTELIVRLIALYGLGSIVGYSIVWWSVPLSWIPALCLSIAMFLIYRKRVKQDLDNPAPEAAAG